VASLDSKLNPLKQTFILLLLGVICFSSCRKERNYNTENVLACEMQQGDPEGLSYPSSSITEFRYSKKNCGIIPLSTKSYWVYQDSIFNNGVFAKVQYDTLRFASTWKSSTDGFIWWKSNISVGLPKMLHASDSAIFGLETTYFNPDFKNVQKQYSLFEGESSSFLTTFSGDDVAANGIASKLQSNYKTPAGIFGNCIYFEKNARGYRNEQIILKPGIGIVKFKLEKALMGSFVLKLQQTSTLISYHIE
jgi:hypothetical protein